MFSYKYEANIVPDGMESNDFYTIFSDNAEDILNNSVLELNEVFHGVTAVAIIIAKWEDKGIEKSYPVCILSREDTTGPIHCKFLM